MKEAVITGAARTAIGSLMGALADVPAPGWAVVIGEAVYAQRGSGEDVEQVIMGKRPFRRARAGAARAGGYLRGCPVSAGRRRSTDVRLGAEIGDAGGAVASRPPSARWSWREAWSR